jgi:ferric-dicitrate binding protein FerR (iron transport regulator)
MDYKKFNVEDFASNDSFIDWVNQSDPEAVKYWDLYISTHPEIRDMVDKARTLVLNIKLAERTAHDTAREESMWQNIQRVVESPVKSTHKVKPNRVAVLASILFACASGVTAFFLLNNNSKQSHDYYTYQQEPADFIEQVNHTDAPQKVQLQDGTTVVLGANSSLKYKPNYMEDSIRRVYLFGEAFFDVVKNPYKPFIVHSNEVFVKVLGTSFRVSAFEDAKNVVVSVKTGKVSVYAFKGSEDRKEGVILLPNQQVSYERSDQSFEKTLIATPEILNSGITKTDFVFENTPIAEVFKTIEIAYGIEIVFNEEIMKNCYLTAPLGAESMLEKLRIICQTIGANYEIIDANIVINSSGC